MSNRSRLELTKNSRPHASAATSVREHKILPSNSCFKHKFMIITRTSKKKSTVMNELLYLYKLEATSIVRANDTDQTPS